MLDYSELTIVKNTEGIPTALGYPINSLLLQHNKPLFVGGGKNNKKTVVNSKDEGEGENEDKGENEEINFQNLAIPAGLLCMTKTVCIDPNAKGTNAVCRNAIKANAMETNAMETNAMETNEMDANEMETIPEGLYEQLLLLAETKTKKNKTKKQKQKPVKKNKTKRQHT
jgi:hypothetical protein